MKTTGANPLPSAEAKIPLLENLGIFQSLTSDELETVARHSDWLRFRKGDVVLQDHGEAGRLFVVFEGEAAVLRKDEKGREISLATFDNGRNFGEFSLFEGPRTDTITRCEEDTTLLAFPREPADAFFMQNPLMGAKVIKNLLGMAAERIRTTNRLIAEKTPWVQELRRRAMVDKLTGLYNTSYLEEDFLRIIDAKPPALSLLMMKPDNFKTFNDTYGHEAGDRVLQLMAAGTKCLLGDTGIPVRFKGDVFAVVIPDTDAAAAKKTAVRLQHAMKELDLTGLCGGAERMVSAQGKAHADTCASDAASGGQTDERITVCIGITSCPGGGGATAPILIDRAYENLFQARGRGANRICSDEDES